MTDTIADFAPIRAGDLADEARIARIFDGLQSGDLPKPEWTHAAHLVAGAMMVDRWGVDEAKARMPGIIRNYNVASGGRNTDTEGYHHTLTLFFLHEINRFLKNNAEGALSEKITTLLASDMAQTEYPLGYYTKETLFSLEARKGWVEPDVKALETA